MACTKDCRYTLLYTSKTDQYPHKHRQNKSLIQNIFQICHVRYPIRQTLPITGPKEFMVDDQRFATSRPDVITFMTEPLCDTLTLAGPIEVELMTAISSTDADFMVKVIDVYPEKV